MVFRTPPAHATYAIWLPNAPNKLRRGLARPSGNARASAALLMSFVLPNNKYLAQASREELAAASERYMKQGQTMCHHARWFRLCAGLVPEGKVLKDVMDEERLAELHEEAKVHDHD